MVLHPGHTTAWGNGELCSPGCGCRLLITFALRWKGGVDSKLQGHCLNRVGALLLNLLNGYSRSRTLRGFGQFLQPLKCFVRQHVLMAAPTPISAGTTG